MLGGVGRDQSAGSGLNHAARALRQLVFCCLSHLLRGAPGAAVLRTEWRLTRAVEVVNELINRDFASCSASALYILDTYRGMNSSNQSNPVSELSGVAIQYLFGASPGDSRDSCTQGFHQFLKRIPWHLSA